MHCDKFYKLYNNHTTTLPQESNLVSLPQNLFFFWISRQEEIYINEKAYAPRHTGCIQVYDRIWNILYELQVMPTISSNQKQFILIQWVEFLPQKHWEAYNEINSIKQGPNFVHGCPVHKLIIWELHMFKIKITCLSLV